ncbi:MAG: phosphocholine cytidylyltransferase family protein [Desulfobulbaceae bacterium]|nr:phosphocholine cytidylyltransferase family protein [Desulfobulbaceae bacterium]
MKAIILSAGQGTRLLPLTAKIPKCLLDINGKTIIEWQIEELHKCGVDQITVVIGYRADKVENLLRRHYGPQSVQTHYNPDYATTDNLVSCWKVRDEMNEDFILLNGDTLFEAAVVKSLLQSPASPITVTVSHKDIYDADDMKVSMEGSRLTKVGKDIPFGEIHGESIGMILFRDTGPTIFQNALENAMTDTESVRRWYLSVIDEIAQEKTVLTCSIRGLAWCEIDYPADLKMADRVVAGFSAESRFETAEEDFQRQKTAAG